ncbi:hypothetical protein WJX72_008252 [[Myrmecia] bisecta]|uniref:phosphatidyl-N-methylethanolamine N-methyltransferase n=1 Tax=[Myrmecia] bisecta TaxID=41462 RepID=A0AAW1QRP6_9CHLO
MSLLKSGAASPTPVLDWLVILAISLPHILYAFIWFFPKKWKGLFRREPVLAFNLLAWLLKVVQFSAVVWWYVKNAEVFSNGKVVIIDPWRIPHWSWFAFGVLVAAGQALNLGIFHAIGSVGVYYGTKLGHKVPWHKGFPFNIVWHPQYVGSVLTIWGLTLLVWEQAPKGTAVISAYWTAMYVVTALQEQFL